LGARAAQDQFHVSSSGDRKSLVGEKSECLAMINIPASTVPRPTLEQLLILASVVSAHQPNYHLLRSQCYWYAFTIWEVFKISYPNAVKDTTILEGAGTNGLLPWIRWNQNTESQNDNVKGAVGKSVIESHQELAEKFSAAWQEFEARIEDYQQVSHFSLLGLGYPGLRS
jgi:hypothetical protein